MHSVLDATDVLLRARLRARGYRSRFVSTRAGRIHVFGARGVGRSTPWVVLHGLAAASHHYASVLEPMRAHARAVYAPDLPGHGKSPLERGASPTMLAEAVGEALASLLDEPALVFGNSLGGAVGIHVARARPALVAGLFLVAPGGAPMEPAIRARFLRRFDLRGHDEALAFVDDLFAAPHPWRQLLAWGTRRKLARPEMRALLSRLDETAFLTPAHLAELTMPVHVVWGGADRILPAENLDFFRAHLPRHARIDVVPHYGHTPQIDHPSDLCARLERFARDVDSRSPLRSA